MTLYLQCSIQQVVSLFLIKMHDNESSARDASKKCWKDAEKTSYLLKLLNKCKQLLHFIYLLTTAYESIK